MLLHGFPPLTVDVWPSQKAPDSILTDLTGNPPFGERGDIPSKIGPYTGTEVPEAGVPFSLKFSSINVSHHFRPAPLDKTQRIPFHP
jgi:hypothetical protein